MALYGSLPIITIRLCHPANIKLKKKLKRTKKIKNIALQSPLVYKNKIKINYVKLHHDFFFY